VAALTSLAAVPLAGITAGSVASASTVKLSSKVTPADRENGKPLYRKTSSPASIGQTFSCQAPESATNPLPCYGPTQIRTAYDIPNRLTGAGQTIVIIDAFGDPTVSSDLALFDSTFGLPNPKLNVIYPDGQPTFDPTNADEVGWAGEISLDVQWSHAVAPGATIDLVVAKSDQDSDILAAQQYAIGHNLGSVLTQSFSEAETCMEPAIFTAQHQAFTAAAAENMSVFASAGDDGAAQPACSGDGYIKSVGTPASDPLVTSVGGTHLNASYINGSYESESVWNDSGTSEDIGAGGGGFSTIYTKPAFQNSANTGSSFRGVPDVTYNADIFGGVLAVCSECNNGTPAFFIFAGTSSGSPQWAAITALADQQASHRLGDLNPALYTIGASGIARAAFHDVTVGNNTWDVSGVTGYSAHRGWDAASGLGSPNAAILIGLLALP
jgi:subtilase family serine protease